MSFSLTIKKGGNVSYKTPTQNGHLPLGKSLFYARDGDELLVADEPSLPTTKLSGIAVRNSTDHISVSTDIFRSIPLYITHDTSGDIHVTSEFADIASLRLADRRADAIGCIECAYLGSPIHTRTIVKSVKQIPAASCADIKKSDLAFDIKPYWTFEAHESSDSRSENDSLKKLHVILTRIFESTPQQSDYLMGVSGGLDSRVSLGYLSRAIDSDRIRTFTFGYDPRILEYEIAKEVTRLLRIKNAPYFHQLKPSDYSAALDDIVLRSGGAIAANHCHMMSYLKDANPNALLVSNAYTDAVFGYATSEKKNPESLDSYLQRLVANLPISDESRDLIREDYYQILRSFDTSWNYSSFDEYLYVRERNSKFHLHLHHLLSHNRRLFGPFLDFELLNFMLSLPLKERANKEFLAKLLDQYFPELGPRRLHDISSRKFRGEGSHRVGASWLAHQRFRLINFANAISCKWLGGSIQILNREQTEQQGRALVVAFGESLRHSDSFAQLLKAPTDSGRRKWSTFPLDARGLSERFQLISLKHCLDTFQIMP